jgi:DNA polymerase-4/protein ImuB
VRGRGARQARLQLLLEGNRSWERTVALKGTVGEPHDLYRTLRFRLAGLTLDGAVEEIVLELAGLSDIYARQEQLFGSELKRRQQRSLSEAARQLKQRYGATPLYRVMGIEPWSRIPERRWGLFGYE